MTLLTEQEARVVHALVDAWNAFLALPVEHPDAQTEFRHGIHALQAMVFARPAVRWWNYPAGVEGPPAPEPARGKIDWSKVKDCHGIGHTGCGYCERCTRPPEPEPAICTWAPPCGGMASNCSWKPDDDQPCSCQRPPAPAASVERPWRSGRPDRIVRSPLHP